MAVSLEPIEVSDLILRFLKGDTAPYEWDDFTSVPCQDPIVEAARLRCILVRDEFPPESPHEYCNSAGEGALRQLAERLRAPAT